MEIIYILIRKDVLNAIDKSNAIHNRVITETQNIPEIKGLDCSYTNPQLKAFDQAEWNSLNFQTKHDLLKTYWYSEVYTIFERTLCKN